MRIAVLMPTKGRAEQMKARVNGLLCNPLPDGVELVLVLSVIRSDGDTIEAAMELVTQWYESDVTIVLVKRGIMSTAVDGWNLAYEAVKGVCDWFVLGADDCQYQADWLHNALQVARETGADVIGLNDGHTNLTHYGPHYMVSQAFCRDVLGGFIHNEYKAWWFDREVCEIAAKYNAYAPAWDSHVIHTHPDWKTARVDNTYAEAMPLRDEDKRLYQMRRKTVTAVIA